MSLVSALLPRKVRAHQSDVSNFTVLWLCATLIHYNSFIINSFQNYNKNPL